ncbi:esterase-like activity of phytase family protein [Mesorhizobium marinum]|uniref:esterase-like activity of phytase family protein n=1 Tax=Mesorhizobium marinum TaxID=3228790 RepID=UPI003F5B03C1
MNALLRRGLAYGLFAAAALGLALWLTAHQPVRAAAEGVERLEVSASPIRQFRLGVAGTRFGPLEFVGGLELSSASRDFGALSSFRFLTPGGDFVGVADTGFWFFGTIARDADGRPTGIENFRMQQMFDRAGRVSDRKWEVDAESLDVRDGVATVGFERDHRIARFKLDPDDMKPAIGEVDFLIPKRELRQNRGFETVAHAPLDSRQQGALVIVSEKSLDKQGNIFAAVVEGPEKGIFTVKRLGEFDVTDGAFLPGGDLLLLERSFSMATGVKMRLRRIAGETIAKGAVADGPVLFEADMGYQIDNMEGLDVWTRADGALVVSIISDDNHSILQRNLYLEFVLHDEPHEQASDG